MKNHSLNFLKMIKVNSMNIFGFVVGTTLISTLFLFDLYFTKYTQRATSWGEILFAVLKENKSFEICGQYFVLSLWVFGLIVSKNNQVTGFQFVLSLLFWAWFLFLFIASTISYYKWKKENNEHKQNKVLNE